MEIDFSIPSFFYLIQENNQLKECSAEEFFSFKDTKGNVDRFSFEFCYDFSKKAEELNFYHEFLKEIPNDLLIEKNIIKNKFSFLQEYFEKIELIMSEGKYTDLSDLTYIGNTIDIGSNSLTFEFDTPMFKKNIVLGNAEFELNFIFDSKNKKLLFSSIETSIEDKKFDFCFSKSIILKEEFLESSNQKLRFILS